MDICEHYADSFDILVTGAIWITSDAKYINKPVILL